VVPPGGTETGAGHTIVRPQLRLFVLALCAALFVLGAGAVSALRPEAAGEGNTQVPSLVNPSSIVTAVERQREIVAILAEGYYRPVDAALLAGTSLDRLPAVLDDPYTQYLNPAALALFEGGDAGRYLGVGVHARLRGDEVVLDRVTPGGPAAAADLRDGDVVVRADGMPLGGLALEAALSRIRGPIGSTVRLQVRRASQERSVVLRRAEVAGRIVSHEVRMVAGRPVGYVLVQDFSRGVGQGVRDAVQDLKARGVAEVVLDLRGNGGGLVTEAVELTSVFTPAGTPVLIESGLHVDKTTYITHTAPADLVVPLVVLADDQTASAAEIVIGALRDAGRATVVGAKTFGKGVVQDLVPLTGGGALKYTMAEYLTPSGQHVNRRGIAPDVAVATKRADAPAADDTAADDTAADDADPVFDAAVRTPNANPNPR